MDLVKKYKEFCEESYNQCYSIFPRVKDYNWTTPIQYIDWEIKDILSAAFFAQFCGAKFDDINPIYEKYKEKFENLLKEGVK